MWTIFKVFTEFVTMLLLFYVLVFFIRGAGGILAPWPGIEPTLPAFGRQSLNHWTTREVPPPSTLDQSGLFPSGNRYSKQPQPWRALELSKWKPKKGNKTLALPGSRKGWPSPAAPKLSSCGPACGIHASATGTSGAGPITWSGGDSRWMFGGMCAIPTGASSSKSISCLSSWGKCQNRHWSPDQPCPVAI